jgi:hypothetical protein
VKPSVVEPIGRRDFVAVDEMVAVAAIGQHHACARVAGLTDRAPVVDRIRSTVTFAPFGATMLARLSE